MKEMVFENKVYNVSERAEAIMAKSDVALLEDEIGNMLDAFVLATTEGASARDKFDAERQFKTAYHECLGFIQHLRGYFD